MLYTTITGFINTENFNKYPVFKIEYYDTPYGVPSKGYAVEYFNDPDRSASSSFDNANRVLVGRDNILSYDWQLGAPAGVSTTDFFKGKFYGYFYARFGGTYNFYVSKEAGDYFRFWFNKERDVTDPSSSSNFDSAVDLKINEWPVDATNPNGNYTAVETLSYSTANLTRGLWYPFLLEFAEKQKEAYISVRYLEPPNKQDADGLWSDNDPAGLHHTLPVQCKKILSAGVTNYDGNWSGPSNASFITPVIITGVDSVSYNRNLNQSNILEFKVPLLINVSTTSGLYGFRFRDDVGLFYDDNNDTYLREGRLIKYYVGYASTYLLPSSYDYIQRFEGIITDLSIDRSEKQSFITIKCQDILYNTISSINENYPNKISYINSDFSETNEYGFPNGISKPITYDSWPLIDAARDLLIKAGIDPTKLYGRARHLTAISGSDYGDFYIQDRNIILKRKIKYGNPYGVGEEKNSDDKYIWSFNFGDTIYDNIAKIADTYGLVFDVTPDGFIRLSSTNSSTEYSVDQSWRYVGTWTDNYDIRADGGKYLQSNEANATLRKDIKGSLFILNFAKNNIAYDSFVASSWSLPYNEYPQGQLFDVEQSTKLSTFGILYGRYPTLRGSNLDTFKYINSTWYFTPTKTFTITGCEYKSYADFPNSSPDTDFGIGANIYIGKVVSNNYNDLVGSSLLYSNYIRQNSVANLTHNITFTNTNQYVLTGGTTYGLRFLTVENEDPPTQIADYRNRAVFTIQNVALTSNYGVHHRADYSEKNVQTGIITSGNYVPNSPLDTGHNQSIFPYLTILGVDKNLGGANQDSKTEIQIQGYNGTTYSPIKTWTISNDYYDKYNSSRELRYPSDGIDFTGQNPCKFVIYGYDIGNETSGGIKLPYNQYSILVKNLNQVSDGTKLISIESFDYDTYNPNWIFDTTRNTTQLEYSESLDEVRNDIIVVGDLIGAFRDYVTDEVINKNNPSLQYVYSRATDVSSINNPDSLNNVGRKKPFIIYEPTITDQRHADWMAQTILYRNRSFRRTPNYESYGIPFLDVNDNVRIIDIYGGGDLKNKSTHSSQWIVSIDENISNNKYYMNFNTTPYEPWGAFTQVNNPDIEQFGNQPFINIRMTDSYGQYRGYVSNGKFDVYESESGNRLMVKFDQVIDGDIVVKVMSKNVMGMPYERPVAYLVGSLQEGLEVPEYREWGVDYELFWDGVDQTGHSRRLLGQDKANIYISTYDSPGFYAASGDYFLRFTIFPRDSNKRIATIDSTTLPYLYNRDAGDALGFSAQETFEELWKIYWSDPIEINLAVSGELTSVQRDITYYPNNHFWSNEYDGNGIQFSLYSTGETTPNRIMYYKVNIDHFWGLGYAFGLRKDAFPYNEYGLYPRFSNNDRENWKTAFQIGMHGNMVMHNDGINMEDEHLVYSTLTNPLDYVGYQYWHIPALIENVPNTSNEPRIAGLLRSTYQTSNWQDKASPLELDSTYEIVYNSTYDSEYVVGWFNVPYTNYKIDGYIPEKIHRYSIHNPIVFYFNPESILGGGWNFEALPDLQKEEYSLIRRHLALMAYYNGPRSSSDPLRLRPITSHAFQANIFIWDSTGRILKNVPQTIFKDTEHSHTLYDGVSIMPTHSHSDTKKKFTLNPSNWPIALELRNEFFNTTVSGLNHPWYDNHVKSFGIGFCNATGYSMYGAWTWHGYWLSDVSESIYTLCNKTVGTNYYLYSNGFKECKHWLHYPSYDEIGRNAEQLKYGIVTNWEAEFPIDDYRFFTMSDSYGTSQEAIDAALDRAKNIHTHYPIFEGINYAIDPYGITEYLVDHNYINFIALNLAGPTEYLGGLYASKIYTEFLPYNVTVDSSFPQIWHFVNNVTFPWSSSTANNKYWTNFLITGVEGITPFEFYYGGWARFDDTKNQT